MTLRRVCGAYQVRACCDSGEAEPQLVGFENRSAAHILVREHRKRRKLPFAGGIA